MVWCRGNVSCVPNEMQRRIAEGGHCDADRFGGRCEAPGVGTEAERGSPGTKPPPSHRSALHPRESCCRCSALRILGAIGRDALKAVQYSAVEVLCEKAGKLRISAAHTLCNA